jgi:hypothetical protein
MGRCSQTIVLKNSPLVFGTVVSIALPPRRYSTPARFLEALEAEAVDFPARPAELGDMFPLLQGEFPAVRAPPQTYTAHTFQNKPQNKPQNKTHIVSGVIIGHWCPLIFSPFPFFSFFSCSSSSSFSRGPGSTRVGPSPRAYSMPARPCSARRSSSMSCCRPPPMPPAPSSSLCGRQ